MKNRQDRRVRDVDETGVEKRSLFFIKLRRPPRSTQSGSSAASDVYEGQHGGALAKGGWGGSPDWVVTHYHRHLGENEAHRRALLAAR